ncbi:FtsX-like permease family protein [Jidongwangia harbinensis]|uniref:FtsX-like permease family protein n=1 Tax=Jidongwangia harbinensis TaxID=2878561 RepID=UPI001CD9F2D2|nr:FtsX-like permease family protein [Jidongwangia harbinensis]MCA2213113.1 FtsX-like permease family protein [Jidongwangia harbinensis]
MLKLTLQMVRRRLGSAFATLVALTAGVMILMTTAALIESGVRFQPEPVRYAAADAVVAHNELTITTKAFGETSTVTAPLPEGGTVPATLAKKFGQLPGVATAVADYSFGVIPLAASSVPAAGHGWGSAPLTPYKLTAGEEPDAADEIVLDARLAGSLAPGASTDVLIGGALRTYTVSGIAQAGTSDGPASVFFTDAQAAKLTPHKGRAAAIGIVAEPGADKAALATAMRKLAQDNGAETYTGVDRGKLEVSDAIAARGLLISLGAAFGAYVALLVTCIVAGTIGLSVRHRRRDLALLRAIAATPGQVRRMIVAEAAILSAFAVVFGIPAGLLALDWTSDELVTRGFIPADFPIENGLLAGGAVAVLITLVAMGASFLAALRVTGIRPTEALGEVAVEPRRSGKVRLVLGLVTFGAAVVLATVTTSTSGTKALSAALMMLFTYIAAVAVLGPWINRFAAKLLSPLLRKVWGSSGYLAGANLRANAQGMVTVLTALVLSVGLGGSIWFLQNNLERQVVTNTRDGMLAQWSLTSAAGLPADAVTEVRKVPGVEAATGIRRTSLVAENQGAAEEVSAQAVDTDSVAQTMDLKVTDGSLANLNRESIAVSTMQATAHGWKVGQKAKLWLGDGTPAELTVAAIYQRGFGFADLTLSRDTIAGHTAGNLDDEILIRSSGGAEVGAALAELAERYPASNVVDTKAQSGQIAQDIAISAWLNKLLMGVMIGYAALAAANTMVMAALARGRELALLRLVGVTRAQVKRMVHAEQVGLLGVSLLVGGVIAALTLTAVIYKMTGEMVPYVPPLGWVAIIGGATLLAMFTTVLPIGRLLRIAPVENIGLKE